MNRNLHICDNCGIPQVDELLTRSGFKTTFYVEWCCTECFIKLEGVSFENFRQCTDQKRDSKSDQTRNEENP